MKVSITRLKDGDMHYSIEIFNKKLFLYKHTKIDNRRDTLNDILRFIRYEYRGFEERWIVTKEETIRGRQFTFTLVA
jgi:hypothetical protein